VTIFVNSNVLSSAAVGSDKDICVSAPAYMTANAPAPGEVGTWAYVSSVPPNSDVISFSDINDPEAVVSGFQTPNTVYNLRWTIDYTNPGTGCATGSVANIEVRTSNVTSPTVASAGADGCFSTGSGSFNLSANSVDGATGCAPTFDEVEVAIADTVTSNAGPDQLGICPDPNSEVTMAASNSLGSTGTWAYVSGPGGFTIVDETSPTTTIQFAFSGTYVFEWVVDAGNCGSVSDSVTIEIGVPASTASINALPSDPICADNLTLTGSAFDSNFEVATWTLLPGAPNTPNIASSNSSSTNITNLVTGQYQFQYEIKRIDNTICYWRVFCKCSFNTK